MLEHIVLARLKPGATPEQVRAASAKLAEMVGRVPGVIEVVAGRNASPERKDQGYNYVLLVRMRDEAARDGYLEDAFHRQVAQDYVVPVVADIIVADVLHPPRAEARPK